MTRHLIHLIWNRKRHNVLLALEIFFSFLVLFTVVLLSLVYARNWRQPLGYHIDRVWTIGVDRKESDKDPAVKTRHRETFRQLFAALADLPDVEIAAGTLIPPYDIRSWSTEDELQDGRTVMYRVDGATDQFRDLVDLKVVAGRWFSREDDGAGWTPVVINRQMAREVFGGGNAVGQIIPVKQSSHQFDHDPIHATEVRRVIGVIEDFRKDGELSTPEDFLFYRMAVDGSEAGQRVAAELPGALLIRVTPQTTAAFEDTLIRRLQAVARDWSFDVRPLADAREDMLKVYTLPLTAVGTVAVFLLLMVALGLTGVVWQTVTQRTSEFGLRRAAGATIPNINRQVFVELVILTSMALVAGVLLVGQVPLLPLPKLPLLSDSAGVYVASVAVSVAAIYLLTLLCGWYPSRLATMIPPAEALHHE